MSDFFNSEIVKNTMIELQEMQDKLFRLVMSIQYSSTEEQREYVALMREFLEKQKVLLFRMSLSDDPEAQITKEKILQSARIFGLKEGQTLEDFFNMLEEPIKKIEKSLDL